MVSLINNLNSSISILLIIFTLITPCIVNAKVFNIPSGNVAKLIEAINEANGNGEDDTIKLKAGAYTLTEVNNITDGPNGLPSIVSNITIKGAGAEKTIIERDVNAPSFRIFHVSAIGTLWLDKLTVMGGDSINESNGILTGDGGGIFNWGTIKITENNIVENLGENGAAIFNNGKLNVTESIISDNFALTDGGGVYNDAEGKIAIKDSLFTNNLNIGSGGGMFNNGGIVSIIGGIVSDNDSGNAGGIYNIDGTVYIEKCIFTRNLSSILGGAIFNDLNGKMTVSNSIINQNGTDGGGGITNDGALKIHNTTIADNGAIVAGGIWNISSGVITLTNSSIVGNIAGDQGGIRNDGEITIINTTLFANSALAGIGGAITNFGPMTITNSTIAQNEAFESGGILNFRGEVSLQNTILALNTSITGVGPDCFGLISSLGNNIIGDSSDCTINLLDSDLTGDPGLGNFTDNGNPGNGHFPLLSYSRAIDAGNNNLCLSDPILFEDQIGQPRRDGYDKGRVVCDIGAIEFQTRFKNMGQCISASIKQNCSDLKGKDRAACNHQQQQFCSELFR